MLTKITKIHAISGALILASLICSAFAFGQSGEAKFPVVKNYGGIYEIPYATINPDPDLTYKIAVEVKSGSENSGSMNPALINLARMINLHVLGGVKPENLEVVAIVHGPATTTIINDTAYKKRFKTENPNTGLLRELKSAGIRIIICGQSMLARNVSLEDLADGVEVSISMLTAFTTFQLQGYAALQF